MPATPTDAASAPRNTDPFRHLLAHLDAFDPAPLSRTPAWDAEHRALLELVCRFHHHIDHHRSSPTCQQPATHHHLPPPPPPTSLQDVLAAFTHAAPYLDHLCPFGHHRPLYEPLAHHVRTLRALLDRRADRVALDREARRHSAKGDPRPPAPTRALALLASLRELDPSALHPPIDATDLDPDDAREGFTLATALQEPFVMALAADSIAPSLDPLTTPRRSALFTRFASTSCLDLDRLPLHELRALVPVLDRLQSAAHLAHASACARDDRPQSTTAPIARVLAHLRACHPHTLDLRDQDLALLRTASDLLWALHDRVIDGYAARHLADPNAHGLTEYERSVLGPLVDPPPLAQFVGLCHLALTLARAPLSSDPLAASRAAAVAALTADQLRDLVPVLRDLHATARDELARHDASDTPPRPS